MQAHVTPAYLRDLRRAERRHALGVAKRLLVLAGGVLVAIPLLLAGIGYVS